MSDPARDAPACRELSRLLDAKDAASIMISNMVGVGILTLPGLVAVALGDLRLALLAWALGGLVSLAGALVHAELGCRFPQAGGDYVFLREAYGKGPAFLSGWTSFVVGFPGAIALDVMAAAQVSFDAVGWAESRWWQLALAMVFLGAITLVHSTGLRWGKRFQNVLTGFKLAILVGIVVAGCLAAAPAPGAPSAAPAGFRLPVPVAALIILFAYSGWNAASYVAGEIREPRRNLPLALVGGVIAVGALYLAVNVTYFRVIPREEMGQTINVVGQVASEVFGPRGGQVLSLALLLVFAGAASAMIITGPRIYYAMAQDGLFPRGLTAVGSRSRVPVRALWLQSAWTAGILIAGAALTPADQGVKKTFEMVAEWTMFAILPFAALTTGSVFILRARDRSLARTPPYSAPGHPVTGIVFICAALAVTVAAFWTTTAEYRWQGVTGFFLVLLGVPVYFLWARASGRREAGRT